MNTILKDITAAIRTDSYWDMTKISDTIYKDKEMDQSDKDTYLDLIKSILAYAEKAGAESAADSRYYLAKYEESNPRKLSSH